MSKKISQLAELLTVLDADILPVVNSGTTKKVTKANLLKEINDALATKSAIGHSHAWGAITGLLSNQTDLQSVLNGKANASHTHDDRYYTESEINTLLDGKEPANVNIQAHIASTSNPHGVTKTQVGLGNVANGLQLIAANNLSDLINAATARTNLGLGTMATQNAASYLPLTGGTVTGLLTVQNDISATGVVYGKNVMLGTNANYRLVQQNFKVKNSGDNGGVEWIWYADADNAVVGNMQLTLYGYPRKISDGTYYGYESFIKYRFSSYDGSSTYTKEITIEANTVFNKTATIKSASATAKVLIVQAASGQTANLSEWQDSSGTVLGSVNASGSVGIGTNNAQDFLHVYSSTNLKGILLEAPDNPRLQFKGSSATSVIRGGDNGQALYLVPGHSNAPTFYLGSNNITSIAVAADATNTLREASRLMFRSRYWNGTNSTDHEAMIRHILESTAPLSRLGFFIGNTEWVSIKSDGRIGFGLTSPTAILHLKAGTATANTAPIKLTAGVNLTTPENGAIEFDGTNLYITVGGIRKTIQVA